MKPKVGFYFVIGFLGLFLSMLGGFMSVLIASNYQLMAPYVFFIVGPAPFGLGFAIVGSYLYNSLIAEKKPSRLTIVIIVGFLFLIIVAYSQFLSWMIYNGVLRTL